MKKIAISALWAYFLLAPTVFIFLHNTAGATLLAAVGAAALLFTRLPDLADVSFLGVLKARLNRTVKEAEVKIQELRHLAASLAEASLSELAMSGQIFHGMPTEDKFAIRDRIVESLRVIGTSDEQITSAQALWLYVQSRRLANVIGNKVISETSSNRNQFDALKGSAGSGLLPYTALKAYAGENGADSEEVQKLLDQYQLLVTSGSMSDPSVIPFSMGLG